MRKLKIELTREEMSSLCLAIDAFLEILGDKPLSLMVLDLKIVRRTLRNALNREEQF